MSVAFNNIYFSLTWQVGFSGLVAVAVLQDVVQAQVCLTRTQAERRGLTWDTPLQWQGPLMRNWQQQEMHPKVFKCICVHVC